MRVVQVRDQRDAGRPEARVVGGARDVFAEFGRELAEHGRDVHADLLEHTSLHHRHHAAAAGRAGVVGALPRRAHEAAGRAVDKRRAMRKIVLDCFEGRANIIAQLLEPRARA